MGGMDSSSCGTENGRGKEKKTACVDTIFCFSISPFLYSSSTLVSLASVYIHVTSQLKHLSLYGTSGGHKPLYRAATAALYL